MEDAAIFKFAFCFLIGQSELQLKMKLLCCKPPDENEYEIQNENSLPDISSVVELRFEKSRKEKIKDRLNTGGSMVLSSLVVLIIPFFKLFHGDFIFKQERNETETISDKNAIDWLTVFYVQRYPNYRFNPYKFR